MSFLTCKDMSLLPFGELPFPPGQDRLLAVHAAVGTARAGQSPDMRLVVCWIPLPLVWVPVPGQPGCPRGRVPAAAGGRGAEGFAPSSVPGMVGGRS